MDLEKAATVARDYAIKVAGHKVVTVEDIDTSLSSSAIVILRADGNKYRCQVFEDGKVIGWHPQR